MRCGSIRLYIADIVSVDCEYLGIRLIGKSRVSPLSVAIEQHFRIEIGSDKCRLTLEYTRIQHAE